VLRRFLVSLAFATWCFFNTWVEFSEGRVAYFARYDPLYAVAVPVVCWEIVTGGHAGGVGNLPRIRLQDLRLLHVFSSLPVSCPGECLDCRPTNFVIRPPPIVRKPLFWPAVLTAAAVPISYAALRPHSASRLMRAIFLYSWPVWRLYLSRPHARLFCAIRGGLRGRSPAQH
jgi:hypothetical protein